MAELLLEWVFTSTFLILVVLTLRAALGKHMSAGLRYGLWAVVLVRLLVPVQLFTSPIAGTWVVTEKRTEQNVYAPADPAFTQGEKDGALSLGVQAGPTGTAAGFPDAPNPPAAPTVPAAPEPPDLSRLPGWTGYLGWVWLAGSAAAALVLLLSNLRFYWRLRRERVPLDAADLPLRVYAAAGLPSPCLFGIVRPAVYVTPEAAGEKNPDMLRHVLAHEYTHYKHGDHIWSLLRCAALAAHWWNPLVWLAVRLSRRDGELACDEGALKRLGDGERSAYGNTLLALVTAKPRSGDLFRCATTMAGDKKSLKERVSRIAQAPKRWLWAAVAAVLVTALACVCAFGQAEPEDGLPIVSTTGSRTELTFSLEEWGEYRPEPAVRVKGSVEGFALEGETEWYPPGNQSPLGQVMMTIPLEDCNRSLHISAEWKDDGRTSVEISVQHVGSKFGSAFVTTVTFTVTQSEKGWTVTEMEGRLPRLSDNRPEREVTDQEAVTLARIASKLLTGAEEYYLGQTGGNEADLLAHFTADTEGVPEDVLHFVGKAVQERYDGYREYLEANPLTEEPIGFDGWRVQALNGPWRGTLQDQDMELEVWRVNYEFHTTTQELALNLVNGGAYLNEDGWLCPTYPNCTYVVFQVSSAGKLGYLTSLLANDCSPDGNLELFYETVAMELERQGLLGEKEPADKWEQHQVLLFTYPDLNRDGVPETIATSPIDGGAGKIVGVWQGADVGNYSAEWWDNADLLWTDEGYNAHVGYNSVFLCTLEGEDYLLRYHPTMYQGYCTYNYQLFTLENGRETVVRENSVEFDINFHPLMHQSFDPEAIAAFMDEINGLLENSFQLINTDTDLFDTFAESGRLYDDLWWLDNWEPVFVRDGSKSLLENLRDYQKAMEAEWYAEEPVLFHMNETEINAHIWLRYQGRSTQFDVDCWESGFQPAEQVQEQTRVLDLNGDGKDEIVFSLVWGHGTGCLVENLYAFDAETLEQYDTGGLNELILDSIKSTGDRDNFYLSAPGMGRTALSKSAVKEELGYDFEADAISLGDIIFYTIGEDGKVRCRVGCDASGNTLGYIGYVEVELEFTGSGFRFAKAEYKEGNAYAD